MPIVAAIPYVSTSTAAVLRATEKSLTTLPNVANGMVSSTLLLIQDPDSDNNIVHIMGGSEGSAKIMCTLS